jgi:fumarylacetoacetase
MNPNDPALRSFIDVAPDCDFPIQNLPLGVISSGANPAKRVATAIGDFALDLSVLEEAGLLTPAPGGRVFDQPSINAFMALGPKAWRETRAALSALLRHDNPRLRDDAALRAKAFVALKEARLHLPAAISGYTDFYSSKEHATNVGVMFRDKTNPLLPNWLHIPIGYNGRASTVVVDGTPVHRPLGQLKPPTAELPSMGACKRLDFELEMGFLVGAPNAMGAPMSMAEAEEAIFGFVLLNDWSARDIQQWEYVPLGPFQAKVFATTISPWVVMREALAPFRAAGPRQEPEPLPYLRAPGPQNYDLHLEVGLQTARMDKAETISRTNFKYMYWSSAQQLVHHALCGCAMNVGDLLGSGTISGPEKEQRGSLLELSWGGAEPLSLASGETRTFLEDGDILVMRGWAQGEGYRVGFGTAAGKILPAPNFPG